MNPYIADGLELARENERLRAELTEALRCKERALEAFRNGERREIEALAEADDLRAELAALRELCGAAYQAVGAADGPEAMLDNLSDAAAGRPLRHAPGAGLPWLPAQHADDEPRLWSYAEDMSTCTLSVNGKHYEYDRVPAQPAVPDDVAKDAAIRRYLAAQDAMTTPGGTWQRQENIGYNDARATELRESRKALDAILSATDDTKEGRSNG